MCSVQAWLGGSSEPLVREQSSVAHAANRPIGRALLGSFALQLYHFGTRRFDMRKPSGRTR